MARKALIQTRRDTAANWTSVNPVLAAGEPGLETDTGKVKYGDGTTAWTSLGYATNPNAETRRTYNIKDYGAAVDGTTDDATAINAAGSAANAAGGGYVVIPVGTGPAIMGAYLQLYPNVVFVGEAGASIKMKNGSNIGNFIRGTSVHYGGILNLKVDYNHSNNTSCSQGMSIGTSSHFTLIDNIFTDVKGFAIALIGNSASRNDHAEVHRNRVINPRPTPNDLLLVVSDYGNVTGNRVIGATHNISLCLYESDSLYAAGNIIELAGSGSGQTGIGMLSLTNSTVIGNKVIGLGSPYTGTGISVLTEFDNVTPIPAPSTNNTIAFNTLKHLSAAIELRDTSDDVVRGNRLEEVYFSFQFPSGSYTSATNIHIKNNDVDSTAIVNNPKDAIRIWYKDNAAINITTHEGSGAEYPHRTITSGSSVNVDRSLDTTIFIKKTVGSATSVVLPNGTFVERGKEYTILDGKGDAATNNITVTTTSSQTINGSSSTTITTNYGAKTFKWDGDEWNIINSYSTANDGTVSTVSVETANGLAGSVANASTTPAITLSTTVTGLLKGNGTAISAASAGTDYLVPSGNGSSLTGLTQSQIASLTSDLANKPSKTTANTYTAGMKQTVSHDATNAGFNLGNVTGDPSGALEGDVWYNSSTDTVLYRAGASTQTFAVTDAAQTFANKRITRRAPVVTQSATPAINTDVTDVAHITGLAQAITSMTSSLTGTPVEGDQLRIDITDNGTARAITWGASFESSTASLPTTTVVSTRLDIMFVWNSVTSKWRCLAVA